ADALVDGDHVICGEALDDHEQHAGLLLIGFACEIVIIGWSDLVRHTAGRSRQSSGSTWDAPLGWNTPRRLRLVPNGLGSSFVAGHVRPAVPAAAQIGWHFGPSKLTGACQ